MTDHDPGSFQPEPLDDLIARLEAIEAGFESPAPWHVDAVWSGIRHLQRNCDVMQECLDDDDEDSNLPGRYDGEPIANLRNILPEIIAVLKATRAGYEAALSGVVDHNNPNGEGK